MNLSINIRVLIVLFLLTLALSFMVIKKQRTLMLGTPVLLETEPVDPRSLFRGDYVRISYTIRRLDLMFIDGDDEFSVGDDVYVKLAKKEKYWQATATFREMPVSDDEHVVIRGRVERLNSRRWDNELQKQLEVTDIFVKYGIEHYFVSEGTGHELEIRGNGRKVDLRIVVDAAGDAAIKAVLVDDEVKYVETLF